MEHDMDISGEMQASDALYKTPQQFKDLKKSMMDAIAKKPKIQPERPNLPGLPSEKEIEEMVKLCNLAYANNEIFSSLKLLTEVFERGIYWFPALKARLALLVSGLPGNPLALSIAMESITNNPEETDAYFAIAVVLRYADSPFQAKCWFDIAKKGIPTMTKAMVDFENDLKYDTESFIQREASVLAILSSSKELERFQNQATVKPWFNSQATKHGIARIQENPTRENLRTECAKNVPFRRFVQRLAVVGAFLGLYSFTFLEGDKLASSLKRTGGSFYNWDQTLVSHLSYYLDLSSISKMQIACLPFRQMFDDRTVWFGVFEKLTGRSFPSSPSSFDLPRVAINGLGMSSPKAFVKSWIYCVQFHDLCMRSETLKEGEMPKTGLMEALTRLEVVYGYYGCAYPNVFIQWVCRVTDILAMDLRNREKWHHVTPLVLTLSKIEPLSFLGFALDYLALVSSGQDWVSRVLFSFGHENLSDKSSLCSTIASLRVPPSYDWKCVLPSDMSVLHLGETVAFDLNGIYHFHMVFADVEHFKHHESGVAYISYGRDGVKGGCSMASSNGFDITLQGTGAGDVRNQFAWTLTCSDGTRVYLTGIAQPSGLGGYFCAEPDTEPEPENPILGYWHMRRAKLDLNTLTEEVALNLVPQQQHRFLDPLRSPPSNFSVSHAKLRLLHGIMTALDSPDTTVQDILHWKRESTDLKVTNDLQTKFTTTKSPHETDMKYEMRKEVFNRYAFDTEQQRRIVVSHFPKRLEAMISILLNRNHPEFEAALDQWRCYLCFSGLDLENEIGLILSILEEIQQAEEEDQEEDDDEIDEVEDANMRTIIAVVAIGVTVLSIAAFVRTLLLRRKPSE